MQRGYVDSMPGREEAGDEAFDKVPSETIRLLIDKTASQVQKKTANKVPEVFRKDANSQSVSTQTEYSLDASEHIKSYQLRLENTEETRKKEK